MDIINLNSFLKFGYFLNYKFPGYTVDFSGTDKLKYVNVPEDELIDIGVNLWNKAIEKQFITNEKHVVPLSGGLDSRAILGGLLKFTEAENIYTYTFGTPGTLDYDIGNYVAKKCGTKHINFSLTNHTFTLKEEIEFSKKIDHQTILFHHPPIFDLIKHYKDYNIWSGFMGDPIAGSHLMKYPSLTNEKAEQKFIDKNKFVKSTNLLNNKILNNDLGQYFNQSLNQISITLDEWYDFNYRQLKYIAPHVLMKGFNYKTPFLDKEWFNFMLSVPERYRFKQNLYNKILIYSFPIIFSYKTKFNSGLPLQTNRLRLFSHKGLNFLKRKTGLFVNQGINYIDFDAGIRKRNDLNKLIYENIMDLKQRQIVEWIDIDKIWENHTNKKANHADALIVLASLEIHLKAGKKL